MSRDDIPNDLFKNIKSDPDASYSECVVCKSFSEFKEIFSKYRDKKYHIVIKNDEFNQRFGFVVYIPLFNSVEGTWYKIDAMDVNDGRKWGYMI